MYWEEQQMSLPFFKKVPIAKEAILSLEEEVSGNVSEHVLEVREPQKVIGLQA